MKIKPTSRTVPRKGCATEDPACGIQRNLRIEEQTRASFAGPTEGRATSPTLEDLQADTLPGRGGPSARIY